jgi:phosphate transport system permease protein
VTTASPQRAVSGRPAFRRAAEPVITRLIWGSGWLAIIILAAIAGFLVYNALQAFQKVGLWPMVSGTSWYPTSTPPLFGFLPAELGSVFVTITALMLAVPLGVAAAVHVSEFTGRRTKEYLKSVIEFMAAVPSVVYGLIGIRLLSPVVQHSLNLSSGLTALSAGLMVGVMALPTIVSISEDALHAVPDELRQGSLALGNTRWQTIRKVIIPSASAGIFAAVMLGLGRAIGETMVVLMMAGNAGVIPTTLLESVKTMPGTIAQEMGETVQGGLHFSTLFAMGLVLFSLTFAINLAADVVLERQRKKWRR